MQNITYAENLSLKELPLMISTLLHISDLPWLNSLEFCTTYVPNPAEYVLLKRDDRQIHKAIFYRVIKKTIGLRVIEIVGFPDITDEEVTQLITINKAHLATTNRLEPPVKHHEEWHTDKRNVYHKSYITIAPLPTSNVEYWNALGKNERKQLAQYLKKLNEHLDNKVEIRYEFAKEIKFEDVLTLEYLNRERRLRKGKGVNSPLEIQERQRQRWPLTTTFGLLMTFRFEGKIIGGTLNYLYGQKAAMVIVAHNQEYDPFRLGKLSVWKTMDYLITQGMTACNFLWGRHLFKTQFLGIEYPWSIHVISEHQSLVVLWKATLMFDEFSTRVWRFVKTKARFEDVFLKK